MDKKEIANTLEYFGNIARNHGYKPVSATFVYQTFEDVTRLRDHGFTLVKNGVYARPINTDISHRLKLQPIKGASYSIWWGVSLSYVPDSWRTSLRFHRTLKSSQFDLFEMLPSYAGLGANLTNIEREQYLLHASFGESYMRETTGSIWSRAQPLIFHWFASTISLEDVLHKAIYQAGQKFPSLHHHPNPMMVAAFTLSRLRRFSEAEEMLERFFKLGIEPHEFKGNLMKALTKIASN